MVKERFLIILLTIKDTNLLKSLERLLILVARRFKMDSPEQFALKQGVSNEEATNDFRRNGATDPCKLWRWPLVPRSREAEATNTASWLA